jgi:putative transcriptional regulator
MKNRIRERRQGLGLTQEQLAEQAGVSRQTIISIEGGRYDPSLPLALRLAGLLGQRVEDLFIPEEE